jgi:hypothetical protein
MKFICICECWFYWKSSLMTCQCSFSWEEMVGNPLNAITKEFSPRLIGSSADGEELEECDSRLGSWGYWKLEYFLLARRLHLVWINNVLGRREVPVQQPQDTSRPFSVFLYQFHKNVFGNQTRINLIITEKSDRIFFWSLCLFLN